MAAFILKKQSRKETSRRLFSLSMICLISKSKCLQIGSLRLFLISLMHILIRKYGILSLGYRKSPSIASLFQQYSSNPSSSVMHILSMLLNAAGSPFSLCVCVYVCAHMCLSGCVRTWTLQCVCVWRGGGTAVENPAEAAGISCKFFWCLNCGVQWEVRFWLKLHDYSNSDNPCSFHYREHNYEAQIHVFLNRKSLSVILRRVLLCLFSCMSLID